MPDQDPFKENKTPPVGDPNASDNPFEDKLKAIVNEDGKPKYQTVEQALEALGHSQQHIKKLEAEKAEEARLLEEARKELEKRETVEEVANRLSQNQTPAPALDKGEGKDLDEKKVQDLVSQMLRQNSEQAIKEQNLTSVITELSKVYGDKAQSVIAERAKVLETTPAALKQLAETNPKMAMQLLSGVDTKTITPSKSTFNNPPPNTDDNPKPEFTRSMTRGGVSNSELADAWGKVKEYTHKRLGVET